MKRASPPGPASPGVQLSPTVPREVYTVSRLNDETRALLEANFPPLWIEGELSNLARPSSGHLYFSLKDGRASVRCAMFRMYNQQLAFSPTNGAHVMLRARVSLYPERGEFQLIVEYMEPAGAGLLRQAFELLKQRLAAEGLFAAARKQSLPSFPRQVGVITSPTGAALRDILSVLRRRYPMAPVLIYPAPVQGTDAAATITRLLSVANQRAECDLLVLARGGGSLEDLWAFNEESVARGIAASRIPVVTGIGHEIDLTIADLVADLAAPTPSAAAELITPDQTELRQRVRLLRLRLSALARGQVQDRSQALEWLVQRLGLPPRRHLLDFAQRQDHLALRLARAAQGLTVSRQSQLATLSVRLERCSPWQRLAGRVNHREQLHHRLRQALQQRCSHARLRLHALHLQLETMSPLRTLDRGYAIVTRCSDGSLVRAAEDISLEEQVNTRLARAALRCTVNEIKPD